MDVQWLIKELGLNFLPPSFLVYHAFIFAPTLYGLIHYRRLSKSYQLLVQMLVLIFIKGWAGRWLIAQYGTNAQASHFMVLINLAYYGWIYYILLKGFSLARKVVLFCTIAFLIFSMFNSFYFTGLMAMPSIGIVLISTLVVTSALLLYYHELQNPTEISIFKQPAFWFNSGNLFFYGTTIFVFGFFNYMINEMGDLAGWMDLIYYSNYILYSSHFICLYLEVRGNRSKYQENER